MAHIHDQIDFTVMAFIVHDGKVLLRKHDKYNLWLGVGGHVELDEDPNQAVLREAREEVGLEIEIVDDRPRPYLAEERIYDILAPRFMNRHRINDGHEHVDMIYFARSSSGQITQQKDEQSEACHWLSLAELEALKSEISGHVYYYAEAALKTVMNEG